MCVPRPAMEVCGFGPHYYSPASRLSGMFYQEVTNSVPPLAYVVLHSPMMDSGFSYLKIIRYAALLISIDS